MGIREEIKKLKVHTLYLGNKIPPEEVDLLRRADVFSIFDKHLGECVAEGTIAGDGLRKLLRGIKPRDRIAIYRLRPAEIPEGEKEEGG